MRAPWRRAAQSPAGGAEAEKPSGFAIVDRVGRRVEIADHWLIEQPDKASPGERYWALAVPAGILPDGLALPFEFHIAVLPGHTCVAFDLVAGDVQGDACTG